MTYGSGIFILTKSFSAKSLTTLLSYASTVVLNKLYLKLPKSNYLNPSICHWKKIISLCYSTASEVCPSVNVCLLLPRSSDLESTRPRHFEVIITDSDSCDKLSVMDTARNFGNVSDAVLLHQPVNITGEAVASDDDHSLQSEDFQSLLFQSVCLGGTFDQLHNGHRIILSIAALLAKRRLCVGITDECLLHTKLLCPLIQVYELRYSAVAEFLGDIGYPGNQTELCCLTDPFGPPIHDRDFDCIIASPESIPGCEKINELRAKKSWPSLKIEEINFVKNSSADSPARCSAPPELMEEKLSSSVLRLNLLGRLLKHVSAKHLELRPYIIGLVGPAGSGKSSITRHLISIARDQIHILPVDQLAHDVYKPGTETYAKLIDQFSPESIICTDAPHFIDRKALGRLVFNSPAKLKLLNSIVWPAVADSIEEKISVIRKTTSSSSLIPVVLLDAALLFDAGWDTCCHEVWATYVPRNFSEERIASRDSLTLEDARRRLDSQSAGIKEVVGNHVADWWTPCQLGAPFGPISRCNVVFCSQWDVNFTRKQVELAWTCLESRINNI